MIAIRELACIVDELMEEVFKNLIERKNNVGKEEKTRGKNTIADMREMV